MSAFDTVYSSIFSKIDDLDPVLYGRTRNFKTGAVSKLSPYISRGVISTKLVMERILKHYQWKEIEKFLQELAWRDHWQLVWRSKAKAIDTDLKNKQEGVEQEGIPLALIQANTGILAVDKELTEFYNSGYMHNHMRMYIASLACNIGKTHWLEPARWMYYHLLDADWGTNALSWQWVVGTNSHKRYYANQANINKYFFSDQRGSYLDQSYDALIDMGAPEEWKGVSEEELRTELPEDSGSPTRDAKKVFIYNFYNLDPEWRNEEQGDRVLLIEPSVFKQYPISSKSMNFMLKLSENIDDIKLVVKEFSGLEELYPKATFYFKEHPLNKYSGVEDQRDWMFGMEHTGGSFFKFWKNCTKQLA